MKNTIIALTLGLLWTPVFINAQTATPEIAMQNLSNLPTPGFNRVPLLGKSFEGNIFIQKHQKQFRAVALDEKIELFYSGDTYIPYILKAGDTVSIKTNEVKNSKFPYVLSSADELRSNEILFFQEAVMAGHPLLYWETGNQIKGLIVKNSMSRNFTALKKLQDSVQQFCDEYFTRKKVSADFRAFATEYVRFDHYCKVFQYLDRKAIDSLINTGYFDFTTNINNPYYNCNYGLQGALYQYMLYQQKQRIPAIPSIEATFSLSDSLLNQGAAALYKYLYLKNNFEDLYASGKETYSTYISRINNIVYESVLNARVNDLQAVLKNKSRFFDANGLETTLQKIIKTTKGKVVYVDFWASWCAPCRKEFSFYPALIKSLNNPNVVFVFISIDSNRNLWRKAMKAEELNEFGSNYIFLNADHEELKKMKIDAIPRYHIYNKEGKLVSVNAAPPGDPELLKLIQRLSE